VVRRIAAAVLVPLLLVAGVANAAALYRCRMDGMTRQSCCCPTDEQPAAASQEQTVSNQNCCAVQVAPRQQTPTSTAPRTTDASASFGAVVVPSVFLALVRPSVLRLAKTARAPGLGPPLIAIKSSRLI
jgi:hypothetical protein